MKRKPRDPRKPPLESDITKSIREWLKLRGIFHWKVFQSLGATPGIPDIICVVNGLFVGIEVKTENGKLSEKQEEFKNNVTREGGVYLVARCTQDVIDFFEGEF